MNKEKIRELPDKKRIYIAMVFVYILANVIDLGQTIYGVSIGLHESNPLAAIFVDNVLYLSFFKVAGVALLLIACSWLFQRNKGIAVFTVFVIVLMQFAAVVNNFLLLI